MIGAETRIITEGDEPISELSFPDASEYGGLLWPELRVVRAASIDDYEYEPEWSRYLNVIGKENRGKGQAFSLGSIAVTLVGAQEMGKMIQSKYPEVFRKGQRKKSLQKMRSIGKKINGLVRTNEKNILNASYNQADAVAELRIAQLEDPEALFLDMEERVTATDIHEASFPGDSMWSEGFFRCDQRPVDKFSSNGLGIDLSDSEELHAERAELRDFFDCLGMDVRYMDKEWKPHFTPFKTLASLGKVALTVPRCPDKIYLEQPKAMVNDNNPV